MYTIYFLWLLCIEIKFLTEQIFTTFRVLSSTLNRPERKSKERSPTSFRLTSTSSNNNINNSSNNHNHSSTSEQLPTLASVIAVSTANASLKRDEDRTRRITPPDTVRLEIADSSVVYVSPEISSSTLERKLSDPHITRCTTTVRVGCDVTLPENLATTIEVIGTSDDSPISSKEISSTSDKESTDDETSSPNDHEMALKLSEQNAERLRRIRETRRRASPSVTVVRTLSGDEDSDYDADCSATESPRKSEKAPRMTSSSSSCSSTSSNGASRVKASPSSAATVTASRDVTIFEEEEEEDNDSVKNRVIRRIDTR